MGPVQYPLIVGAAFLFFIIVGLVDIVDRGADSRKTYALIFPVLGFGICCWSVAKYLYS